MDSPEPESESESEPEIAPYIGNGNQGVHSAEKGDPGTWWSRWEAEAYPSESEIPRRSRMTSCNWKRHGQ